MAERNTSFEAIVLRTKDSPSGDRIATFLAADSGIVDAFVFGGAKSSLRSSASPFAHARAFIYTDPVKQYRKLSDLSVLESFPSLRDSYARLMAASAISELLIRTSACGGEYGIVFDLALRSLRLLDRADESQVEVILLGFLWKILGIMGLEPDLASCGACGRPLTGRTPPAVGSLPLDAEGDILRYSGVQGAFLCPDCWTSSGAGETWELDAGATLLMRAFSQRPMEDMPGLATGYPLFPPTGSPG